LRAETTKGKRADALPLRQDLAELLRSTRGNAEDGDRVFRTLPSMDSHKRWRRFAGGTGATLTSTLLSSALTNSPGFSDDFDIGIVLAPGLTQRRSRQTSRSNTSPSTAAPSGPPTSPSPSRRAWPFSASPPPASWRAGAASAALNC
jgi:hypothetical protein